jgi:hypothetical protein
MSPGETSWRSAANSPRSSLRKQCRGGRQGWGCAAAGAVDLPLREMSKTEKRAWYCSTFPMTATHAHISRTSIPPPERSSTVKSLSPCSFEVETSLARTLPPSAAPRRAAAPCVLITSCITSSDASVKSTSGSRLVSLPTPNRALPGERGGDGLGSEWRSMPNLVTAQSAKSAPGRGGDSSREECTRSIHTSSLLFSAFSEAWLWFDATLSRRFLPFCIRNRPIAVPCTSMRTDAWPCDGCYSAHIFN